MSAALKQWAVYPEVSGWSRLSSPQVFRLLVETCGGRLLMASLASKIPPDAGLAEALAALVDDRRFIDQAPLRIQGEFEARYGQGIELLDVDLDRDDPVALTGIVARTLVEQVGHLGQPGAPLLRRETVEARCREDWMRVRDRFIAGLDREAVRLARLSPDGLTPSGYRYLMSVGAEQRRNREQAVQVFPLLRPYLMMPAFRVVRDAIDQGRPLVDVLATHWQTSRAAIRALNGVERKDLGLMAGRLPGLFRLLEDIPPDWWPRDPATWRLFAKAIQRIQDVSQRPISSASNQLWLRDCARRGYTLGDKTSEDFVRISEEIEEFIDMLRQALEHQHAEALRRAPEATRSAHLRIVTSLRTGLGLEKLAHTARRFGDHYRRAVEEFAREAELWNGVRWPVIGRAEARSHAGVMVHPLQTPEDLRSEGQRMRNCVAGYVENCLRGRSQIWSFRLADGTALSTLETRTRTDRNGRHLVAVCQHKGHANDPPPVEAKRALQEFMLDLHGDPAALAEYQAWRQKVLRRPLSERQRHAVMRPVLAALERTLTGPWAWERLLAIPFGVT